MAKQRTKPVPFDKVATEVEPRVWEWTAGESTWRWHEGVVGLNLYQKHNTVGFHPRVYAKTLREAGYFAEGFASRDVV